MGGAWDNPAVRPVTPAHGVLGQGNGRCYGTPLIMDVLEQNGLRGTFFLEAFAAYNVGEAELGAAYRQIVERGHDVQLHLHPVHYYYSQVQRGVISREQVVPAPPECDILAAYPREQQRALLQDGVRLFQQLVGRRPSAFRAGSYGASLTTLEVLAEIGIRCDTSYNAAYVGQSCRFEPGPPRNRPWWQNGVWEIPVTNFSTGAGKYRGLKPLEVSAVSSWEMCHVLEEAERAGLGTATIMLHSFGLLKKRDLQYRGIGPDRVVIGRLRNLCRFLAAHPDRFRVVTFSDAFELMGTADELPHMGVFMPALRKVVQGINRAYWI